MHHTSRQIMSLAVLAALSQTAQARVLFHDDFESSTATPFTLQQQLDNPALITDSDPINTNGAPGATVPGQWFHYSKTTTPDISVQVTNNIDDMATGTFQGNNVLRFRRATEPPSSTAAMGAYIGDQTSGTIRANWRMMFPHNYKLEFEPFGITFPVMFFFTPYADNDHSDGTSPDGHKTPVIILDSPAYDTQSWARVYYGGFPNSGGGSIELDDPQGGDPAVFHDQWQEWELKADIDAQKFSFSVDGIEAGPFDFNFAGGFSTLMFRVAQAQAQLDSTVNGRFFIDDLTIVKDDPQWNVDADGDWSNAANWAGGVPDGNGAGALFGSKITAPHTVTVDGNKTLGFISFDNDNRYTLTGSTILLNTGDSSSARIDVTKGSHTIASPLGLDRSLVVNVARAADTLTVSGEISATASGEYLIKDGPGTLEVDHVYLNGLTINGGTMKVLAGATANDPANASSIKPLAIAGGPAAPTAKLDLTNNSMAVDYTLVNPLEDIRQYLLNGGIITSSATANTRLGYGEASVVLGAGGGTFAGLTVDDTAVLIKYTYGGDSNLDGKVDVGDLGALASNWQQSAPWTGGDFDYNGTVNVGDLGILATNWQQGVTSPTLGPSFQEALAALGLPNVSVPEPGSSALVLSMLLAGISRRRRWLR